VPELSFLEEFEQYRPIFSFKQTWAFRKLLYLPFDRIASFTGNQYGKTGGYAVQYIYRMMGWHPIPQKNVLYFECPNLVEEEFEAEQTEDESKITHPEVWGRLDDGSEIELHKTGVFTDCRYYPDYVKIPGTEEYAPVLPERYHKSVRPEDNRCPHCKEKLRIHERKTRVFRFCSENLPTDRATTGDNVGDQSTEVKNATYPEIKKWMPRHLIKKDDITARHSVITLHDPNAGHIFGDLEYKGADIVYEFVSYSQTVQAGAGVQRLSCWCDEEPPFDFYDEQLPRLIAEDGDFLLSLTPANRMTWTFDEFYEKAKLYVRTDSICDFLTQKDGKEAKQIEWTDSKENIAVIQAATDDNPTLSKKAIEKKLRWEDPETMATRRYGVFTQATGRVFTFDWRVHYIDKDKYFPIRMPEDWIHGRSIDYHERNDWAIVWACISPKDELFIYNELAVNPTKWTTLPISEEIAGKSGMQRYSCNLIDPLANKVQVNTGETTVEDLNRIFHQLKKDGKGMGGYWQPFDTKGTKGRDEIKTRLSNSVKVGKPFNNRVEKKGEYRYLPTLWVLNNCKQMAQSLKQWRFDEPKGKNPSKDKSEKMIQKWSHFCTALEGLLKDNRFRARKIGMKPKKKTPKYFKGRVR